MPSADLLSMFVGLMICSAFDPCNYWTETIYVHLVAIRAGGTWLCFMWAGGCTCAEAGLEQEDWVGADVSKNVVSCVGGWRGEGWKEMLWDFDNYENGYNTCWVLGKEERWVCVAVSVRTGM